MEVCGEHQSDLYDDNCCPYCELARLRARVTAMEEDKARVDLLERVGWIACYGNLDGEYVEFDQPLRTAIDDARKVKDVI